MLREGNTVKMNEYTRGPVVYTKKDQVDVKAADKQLFLYYGLSGEEIAKLLDYAFIVDKTAVMCLTNSISV